MSGLMDFINRNFIEGIVNDTSYNHFDMITYVIVLFACVYAVLKLLNRLKIEINEDFVIATIPYVFMGSVFRVMEDADLFYPPVKYLFITPLIYFVIFAICFSILLCAKYLEKKRMIKNYLAQYAMAGLILSFAGLFVLVFNISGMNPNILIYSLVPSVIVTEIIRRVSPAAGMAYLRCRMYLFAIFSFLLDSITTYVGVDLMGYANKHPFSAFLASIFGSGIVLIPISLILVILLIVMLEKDSKNEINKDEKYILTLTLIVLGFSMGARNLLAMLFGV